MIKKQIQKHNFLTGGPVLQREIYFGGDWAWTSTVTDNPITFDTNVDVGITIDNGIGDIIFTATENQLQWGGSDIPTEERVREIFREEYYNVLREDFRQD